MSPLLQGDVHDEPDSVAKGFIAAFTDAMMWGDVVGAETAEDVAVLETTCVLGASAVADGMALEVDALLAVSPAVDFEAMSVDTLPVVVGADTALGLMFTGADAPAAATECAGE